MKRAIAIPFILALAACASQKADVRQPQSHPIVNGGKVGTTVAYLPPTIGKPIFTNGGIGTSCGAIGLTRAGQTATLPIVHPEKTRYSASSSDPKVATSVVSGTNVIVTAHATGMTFISIADAAGLKSVCNVGVTTTQAMVR